MKDSMPGIANYVQHYSEKHPGEEVKIFFMPPSATLVFHYVKNYDMLYGEHFHDLTWNNGITHEKLLSDITIPCIYLHAKENVADIVLADASIGIMHARFTEENGQVYLEDLNTEHGTYKNSVRLKPYEKVEILREDEVRLGKLPFTYR